MTHSELFQLGEDLDATRVIEVLDAAAAVGGDDFGDGGDGLKEARATGKPVLLWVFIDRPADDARC